MDRMTSSKQGDFKSNFLRDEKIRREKKDTTPSKPSNQANDPKPTQIAPKQPAKILKTQPIVSPQHVDTARRNDNIRREKQDAAPSKSTNQASDPKPATIEPKYPSIDKSSPKNNDHPVPSKNDGKKRGNRREKRGHSKDSRAEIPNKEKEYKRSDQRQRGEKRGRERNNRHNGDKRVMINFNDDDALFGFLEETLSNSCTEQALYDSSHSFIALISKLSSFSEEKRNRCLNNIAKIYSKDSVIYDTNLERKTTNFEIILKKSDAFIPVIGQFLLIQVLVNNSTNIEDFTKMMKSILLANIGYYQNIEPIFTQMEIFKDNNQALKDLWDFKEELLNQETRSTTEIYPNLNLVFTIPNVKEISNHYTTPWKDFNNYKKVLFNMEQENYLIAFRKGIENLRNGKLDYRDLYLYDNVRIHFYFPPENLDEFQDSSLFLSFHVRWPQDGKTHLIDYKTSNRLTNRSLLILSKDPNCMTIDVLCKSCSLAHSQKFNTKSIHLDLLNKGIVPVIKVFGEFEDMTSYYMFESTSSWSVTQPVLQAIKLMSQPTFPPHLIDPILKLNYKNVKTETDVMVNEAVLKKNSSSSHMVKCDGKWDLDSYPDRKKDSDLKVDHEQYIALKHSIPYDLTLVNGAPGTGKTHFARELLRVLVTKEKVEPIIVITFTNHALDSFLEGVVKSRENPDGFIKPSQFTRYGGPPRTENLTILDRRFKLEQNRGSTMRDLKTDAKAMKKYVQTLYSYLGLVNYFQSNVLNKKSIQQDILVKFMRKLNEVYQELVYSSIQNCHVFTNYEELNEYQEYYKKPPASIKYVPKIPKDFDSLVMFWYDQELLNKTRLSFYQTMQQCRKALIQYENQFQALQENKETNEASQETQQQQEQQEQPEQQQEQGEEEQKEEEEEDDHVNVDADLVEIIESGFITDDVEDDTNSTKNTSYTNFMYETRKMLIKVLQSEQNKSIELLKFTKEIRPKITNLIKSLESELDSKNERIIDMEEAQIGKQFSELRLVGLTSTVASVHKKALEYCKCNTIIIEEAGELTESMSSCILPQTLKHLILIGDYNQLRPKVEHQLTFEPFHNDISLFEKLVHMAKSKNRLGKELYTLSVQRRMHPEISELLRRVFYQTGDEKLTDSNSITWGVPKGIPYRIRFFLHNHSEDIAHGCRSHKNVYKAKIAASLFVLFTSRGYKPEEVTIVVLCKGQMFEV